jgi:hypothetical protein
MVEELGISHRLFETDVFAARIEMLEGHAAVAERLLRGAYDGLRGLGLGIDAAQAAALLGRVRRGSAPARRSVPARTGVWCACSGASGARGDGPERAARIVAAQRAD